jgi:hypothetical protein
MYESVTENCKAVVVSRLDRMSLQMLIPFEDSRGVRHSDQGSAGTTSYLGAGQWVDGDKLVRTCARNHVPGGGAILVELEYSGQPRGSSNFHAIFDAIGSTLTTLQGREEDVERGMRRAYEPYQAFPSLLI